MNDMAEHINCDNGQYAGDALLSHSSKDLNLSVAKLSEECSILIDYFCMHKLKLNVWKTAMLILSPNRKVIPANTCLNIQDDAVQPATSIKYLGVILDDKFTFDLQVKQIIKKKAMGIQAIRCVVGSIPLQARIQLVHALVISHLSYGCVLYNGISQKK